ncbi:hypothetical protein AAE478_008564 [Parahypoxylon ruwenzoriense]
MIATSASGGAVCLRCQLRFLRRSTKPFEASSNRIFSNQRSSLRRLSSQPNANVSDNGPVPEGKDEGSEDQTPSQDGKTRDNIKTYREKHLDLRKRHFSRNRVLEEGAERLGSDMLGKPAYAIVMRDGGIYQKKSSPSAPDSLDENLDNQPADIEALLNSQRAPPTTQEVRDNIDSLKPTAESTLSKKEFRKLQASLTDGFLIAQLGDYINYHKQKNTPHELPQETDTEEAAVEEAAVEEAAVEEAAIEEAAAEEAAAEEAAALAEGEEESQLPPYDWIREISPWVPLGDQPSIAEGSDPILYGYLDNSATVKEKLAVRILRECWGLSIAELNVGLGEVRVMFRAREFALLMRGTKRWITSTGRTWLDPGEKIESFSTQRMLRIVTTKVKSAMLLKDLDETLKQIVTKHIPMNLVTSTPPDDAVLDELGRLTNTYIRKTQASTRFQITWIETMTRAAQGIVGVEDLRHVVFRMLLTAYNPQYAARTAIYLANEDETVGGFVTDTISKEKLEWKDRLDQWSRYVLPLVTTGTKARAGRQTSLQTSSQTSLRRLDLPVQPQVRLVSHGDGSPKFDEDWEIFPKTQYPMHPVKWADDVKTTTKAHFGHLLHMDRSSKGSPPSLSYLLTHDHPRVLAPLAPHPLHLAKLQTSSRDAAHALIQTQSSLLLRLWPAPSLQWPKPLRIVGHKSRWQGPYFPPGPILELRFAVANGQVKGAESLRAIRSTHVTDVLLPSSPVDIRFTQTEHASLEVSAPEQLAAWQPLADFLKPARLDLPHGKLEFPAHQKFPVRQDLFPRDGSNEDTVMNPEQLTSITYTFVGMELHHSISMPYEGCRLTYTSIDAGIGGGQRAEISLEPASRGDIPGTGTTSAAKNLHDDFLATCHKFARSGMLWSGFSADKRKG